MVRVSVFVWPWITRRRWRSCEMEPGHVGAKPMPGLSRLGRQDYERLGVYAVDPVDHHERDRQDFETVIEDQQARCAYPRLDSRRNCCCLSVSLGNVTRMVSGNAQDEPVSQDIDRVDDAYRVDGFERTVR